MAHCDNDDDPDPCTTAERCRGMLELAIIVGIVILMLTWPTLLVLPVVAAAGGLLVVLAIWDDVACGRADKKAAGTRPRAGSTRCGQDRLQGSSGDKRAA